MQRREMATAPPQRPGSDAAPSVGSQPDKAPPLKAQAFDQLTRLAALGWSVTELYAAQLKLAGNTARAEWQLSGRSLVIAAALLVCFGAGVILLWASTLTLLGVVLWQLSQSPAVTAAVLLLLQAALLWWCWRSLSYVLSQVGFTQSWRQLRRLFGHSTKADTSNSATQQEQTNADSHTA